MSESGASPRVVRAADGTVEVQLGDDSPAFRVLAWNPPVMLLGRGEETRRFFVARGERGTWLADEGVTHWIPDSARARRVASAADRHADLASPMPGKVLKVLVKPGERVAAGARLLIIEAMKMEHPVRAPHEGVVSKIHVESGANVQPGTTLIELEEVPS